MTQPIHDIRSIVQVVREGGAFWGVYYLDGSDAGQAWAFFNTENDARVFAASLPKTQEPSSYAALQYGEKPWQPDPRVFRIEAGDNVCGEPDRNEVEQLAAADREAPDPSVSPEPDEPEMVAFIHEGTDPSGPFVHALRYGDAVTIQATNAQSYYIHLDDERLLPPVSPEQEEPNG